VGVYRSRGVGDRVCHVPLWRLHDTILWCRGETGPRKPEGTVATPRAIPTSTGMFSRVSVERLRIHAVELSDNRVVSPRPGSSLTFSAST